MSTYIEKFNFYLKTFLQELITIFPENKDSFTQNYSLVLETDNVNSDEYVKEYMFGVSPYHSDISQKNNKLFLGDNELKFLRDTDFRNLWTKDLSDSTRENIWKYLQTLYVLGKKIVPEDDDVNQMLNELTSETHPLSPDASWPLRPCRQLQNNGYQRPQPRRYIPELKPIRLNQRMIGSRSRRPWVFPQAPRQCLACLVTA